MPASRGRRSLDSRDDGDHTGPITVTDLLAKAGQPPLETPGRRIAARQAIFEVHRHRVRRFLAVLLTFLLALLASVAAYYVGLFFYLDRSVERVDALAVEAPGIVSAQAQDGADNFLIVGTRREGSNRHVTSALIAHLTPERNGAVLVSLPLTAFVDVPACPDPGAELPAEPYGGSLASSFESGGPGCLVRSVQQMSGMRINHYVQLDLGRLPGMVNALGGVPVCLPAAVSAGQMTAPAGRSVLDSDQVRSLLADIDAAQDPTGQRATDRQRLLLASTLREALRLQNLVNPIVLTKFVNEAANALTLDPATTLGELKDLGDKLGQFTAGDTVQASVPLAEVAYQPTGSDDTFALIDDAASRGLFSAIINNSGLPESSAPPDGTATPTPTPDPTAVPTETAAPPAPPSDPNALTVAPQEITVNVYNGIGTPGLAGGAAEQLTAQGFRIGEVENQITGDEASVVRYAPDQLEAARTVRAAVPNSVLQEGSTAGGFIDLIVGSSFEGVVPVLIAPPAPVPDQLPSASAPTSTEPTPTANPQTCG